jgi:two-component system nitrate/nitrite response regulator NarL
MAIAERHNRRVYEKAVAPTLSSSESGFMMRRSEATDLSDGPSASSGVVVLPSRARKRRDFIPAALIGKSTLFRAGLTHVLLGSRFRVTADCSRLSELPTNALGDTRCVALIGLERDSCSILLHLRSLKNQHEGLRIVVFDDLLDGDQLVAAIDAGADGYLVRDEIQPDAVLKSLELILVGGVVVPQGFTKLLSSNTPPRAVTPPPVLIREPSWGECPAETLLPTRSQSARDTDAMSNGDLAHLSARERLILSHLTDGASNKHIARELSIAEATVKAHVKSLLRKIRVNNRTQAAMWAISHIELGSQPRGDTAWRGLSG